LGPTGFEPTIKVTAFRLNCGLRPSLREGAKRKLPDTPGCARGARVRVDANRLHQREVDHQAAITDRVSGDGMAAAANRDEQVAGAREADRLDDVVGARAACDQRRMPINRTVPNAPGLVVAFLPRPQQRAAETRPQLRDRLSRRLTALPAWSSNPPFGRAVIHSLSIEV
jgi:hypothetical protein